LADVVRLRPFRRLWLVFGLSSLGDWLGLLATSSFAAAQFGNSAAQGATFGGIIAVQLLPSLLLGPVAGVLADRFDRRRTMAIADVLRFLLFASIPTAGLVPVNPDRRTAGGTRLHRRSADFTVTFLPRPSAVRCHA
jgi:dTMP kinase